MKMNAVLPPAVCPKSSAEDLQEISLQAQTFHYERHEEQNKSSFAQEGSSTRGWHQGPVGNNKVVRKPQMPCSFHRFIPVLGLIKSRGHSGKANDQAGTAEVLFQKESKDSKAKWRGIVLQSRASSTILTATQQSFRALVPGDCCQWGNCSVEMPHFWIAMATGTMC